MKKCKDFVFAFNYKLYILQNGNINLLTKSDLCDKIYKVEKN